MFSFIYCNIKFYVISFQSFLFNSLHYSVFIILFKILNLRFLHNPFTIYRRIHRWKVCKLWSEPHEFLDQILLKFKADY